VSKLVYFIAVLNMFWHKPCRNLFLPGQFKLWFKLPVAEACQPCECICL